MKREFVLRRLSQLLGWGEARDLVEFPWLKMMSALKFDSYQDFLAGARFVECLVDWLQQFPSATDREIAYKFVRSRLLFVSAAEIQHLVELFYLEEVEQRLLRLVATKLGVPTYRVWSHPDGAALFRSTLRRTLFIGLSDGARMDAFRRANSGVIGNEQIVVYPRINAAKWGELLEDLREEGDTEAKFEVVYLIDDFTASGTSLLRRSDPAKGWKGKIPKFVKDIYESGPAAEGSPPSTIRDNCLSADVLIVTHHYLATSRARDGNRRSLDQYAPEATGRFQRFPKLDLSFGHVLPEDFSLSSPEHGDFLGLIERHYNPSIEQKKHNAESGVSRVDRGYAACAIPLVLEHNTPNNSFAILWAECVAGNGVPEMRPLFRRRQRHTDALEDGP